MAITFVALTLNNTERSGFVRASRAVLPELEVFIAVNGYSKEDTIRHLASTPLKFHPYTFCNAARFATFGSLANFVSKSLALRMQVRRRLPYMAMLEDDMQVLEDARMWLLWELGDYSGQGERDEVNPEDAVVVHELRHELSDLRRRHEEEIRQRRQLERDAMQAMEDLERERSRLEQELGRRKGSEEQQAATRLRLEERLEELQSALDTNGGGSKSHHDEDFLRQAERIATLSWDLENRDSLVHWLLHELDPEVDEERRETQRLCAKEVRALREEMARDESPSPEEELTDPDLLHWLTAKPVVADS